MEDNIRFCSLHVPFPNTAVAVMTAESHADAGSFLIPYGEVFSDSSKITQELLHYQKKADTHDIDVSDSVLIVPLTLSRCFLMRPEFWGKSTVQFGGYTMIRLFSKMLCTPQFFELLVTPGRENGSWFYKPALPIQNGTPDRVIETFMKTSDWYVDTQAKYSAVYSVGLPWSLNIKTHERSQFTAPPGALPEDIQ